MSIAAENVEQVIRDYVAQVLHLSLATCSNNRPWVCEVHFSYDKELNLYFRSGPNRRHSQEIAGNPNVAGNIVVQHSLTEAPRGVYFEGKAERLVDVDELHPAYVTNHERLGNGPAILDDAKKEDGSHFYQITVSDFYLFDARDSRPSQKYHLPWHG